MSVSEVQPRNALVQLVHLAMFVIVTLLSNGLPEKAVVMFWHIVRSSVALILSSFLQFENIDPIVENLLVSRIGVTPSERNSGNTTKPERANREFAFPVPSASNSIVLLGLKVSSFHPALANTPICLISC